MAAWDLVKDLKLDLSGFGPEELQALIDRLDTGEIEEIIDGIDEARKHLHDQQEAVRIALGIARTVLTKGIQLI